MKEFGRKGEGLNCPAQPADKNQYGAGTWEQPSPQSPGEECGAVRFLTLGGEAVITNTNNYSTFSVEYFEYKDLPCLCNIFSSTSLIDSFIYLKIFKFL